MNKALLVGINHYQLPGNNLSGCINDINDMKATLIAAYGYGAGDIQVLTDSQATKANIIGALRQLMASGADHMTFHYSGHGTQFFDPRRNENCDGICPVDIKDMSTLIPDFDLGTIFATAPAGSHLSFIADCCHSGTIDRDFYFGNPHPHRVRTMHIPGTSNPHLDCKASGKGMRDMTLAGVHVLLAGCRDDQTSADACFNNRPNGALTYAIIQAIKHNPKQTWTQLCNNIVSWLAINGYAQVPQLSGPGNLLSAIVFQ